MIITKDYYGPFSIMITDKYGEILRTEENFSISRESADFNTNLNIADLPPGTYILVLCKGGIDGDCLEEKTVVISDEAVRVEFDIAITLPDAVNNNLLFMRVNPGQ